MKQLTYNITIFFLIIILLFSVISVAIIETDFTDDNTPEDNGKNSDKKDNNENDDNNDADDDNNQFEKIVFVEEGTATWCSNCPEIAEILHEVYIPKDPDFYYVSLVDDKNEKAQNRLRDHYNIYGYPTVFFDGGYETCCIDVEPEEKDASLFEKKIAKSASREKPKVFLNLNSEWNESRKELTTTVDVHNFESSSYSGNLKVYISEINSTIWTDYDGNPYHYSFLDYSINKNIKIDENKNDTYQNIWEPEKSGYKNIYPENLWIIAVLFNSESEEKFSDPPINSKPFEANFVDAVVASGVDVSNGSSPPSIGINFPKPWVRYIFGREFGKSLLRTTMIIGRINIQIKIDAKEGVDYVQLKIEGLFDEKTVNLSEVPYEYLWDTTSFGKYTITATVYDKKGKKASDSLEVISLIPGLKYIIEEIV